MGQGEWAGCCGELQIFSIRHITGLRARLSDHGQMRRVGVLQASIGGCPQRIAALGCGREFGHDVLGAGFRCAGSFPLYPNANGTEPLADSLLTLFISQESSSQYTDT